MWKLIGVAGSFLIAALLAKEAAPAASHPAVRIVPTEDIDALFQQLDGDERPGCALSVLHEGKVVYSRGYGIANLGHGIPNSPDSLLLIGSTSKQSTAACVLLAKEEGLLSRDDLVTKWFPKLGDVYGAVTLPHLIHHPSGIRDYLSLLYLSGFDIDAERPLSEVLALLGRQQSLDFVPGERMSYSNSGYLPLGEAVALASGQSLADFAAKRIFEPLGMASTFYCDDTTRLVPRCSEGYSLRPDGRHVGRTSLSLVGDGGVFSSVVDLAMWDAHFYARAIGGPGFLESPHQVGTLNDGTALDYAAGPGIEEWRGLRVVAHAGAFTGYTAEMMRFPDAKLTVICLANREDFDPTRACFRVAALYLADLLAEPAPRAPREPRAAEPNADESGVPPLPSNLEGTYSSAELQVDVRLELRDDQVWYVSGASDLGPFVLTATGTLAGPGTELHLQLDEAGAATGFSLSLDRATGHLFARSDG